MLKQLRRWGMEATDQGPIYLGYRLGHIRGESRVFRALVYNKSAAVLHMLRRLVGDDAFFRGVRRFYRESRFRRWAPQDFRAAMENGTGRSLERFFERWIYGSTLPKLKVGYRVEGTEVVLHVEQIGELFDVPVTVTLQYADRKPVDVLVPVTDRIVDQRVPLEGVLRGDRRQQGRRHDGGDRQELGAVQGKDAGQGAPVRTPSPSPSPSPAPAISSIFYGNGDAHDRRPAR